MLDAGCWILDTGYWPNPGQILEDLVPISRQEGGSFYREGFGPDKPTGRALPGHVGSVTPRFSGDEDVFYPGRIIEFCIIYSPDHRRSPLSAVAPV